MKKSISKTVVEEKVTAPKPKETIQQKEERLARELMESKKSPSPKKPEGFIGPLPPKKVAEKNGGARLEAAIS